MVEQPSNSNNIKALVVLHKAMLTGQLLFGAIAFYLVYSNMFLPSLQGQEKLLQVIAVILSAAGVIGGNALFKKRLLQAREIKRGDIQSRFGAYRSACILQWVLIEGPCLFNIICFLLVGNYAFLALAIALVMYFAILAPSRAKTAIHLQLNDREMTQL